MPPTPPALARVLSRTLGGPGTEDRATRLVFDDAGHGFDRFGLHPDFVALGEAIGAPFYERYFRVDSRGAEQVPATGPVIVAANHSGTLPFDAAMLWVDLLRRTNPPRIPRPVADYFVLSLPFVSTFFARCGVVGGSRGNARALLEAGELLLVFPEGVPGITKPYSQRYKLQHWREGHCALAIRHRAAVVPVAIVGPEEQMPPLFRIPLPRGLNLPYLPIPATPLPLPVRYHIRYGAPIRFDTHTQPEDADDPEVVHAAAEQVRSEVERLLVAGRKERTGIFA